MYEQKHATHDAASSNEPSETPETAKRRKEPYRFGDDRFWKRYYDAIYDEIEVMKMVEEDPEGYRKEMAALETPEIQELLGSLEPID